MIQYFKKAGIDFNMRTNARNSKTQVGLPAVIEDFTSSGNFQPFVI